MGLLKPSFIKTVIIAMVSMPLIVFAESTTSGGRKPRAYPRPKYQKVCGGESEKILKGFKENLQKQLQKDCSYYRSVSNCLGGAVEAAGCGKQAEKKKCSKDVEKKVNEKLSKKKSDKKETAKKEEKDQKQADKEYKTPDSDPKRAEQINKTIAQNKRRRSKKDATKIAYQQYSVEAEKQIQRFDKMGSTDKEMLELLRYKEKFKEYSKGLSSSQKDCVDALNEEGAPGHWLSLRPGYDLERTRSECKAGLLTADECEKMEKENQVGEFTNVASNFTGPLGKAGAFLLPAANKVLGKTIGKYVKSLYDNVAGTADNAANSASKAKPASAQKASQAQAKPKVSEQDAKATAEAAQKKKEAEMLARRKQFIEEGKEDRDAKVRAAAQQMEARDRGKKIIAENNAKVAKREAAERAMAEARAKEQVGRSVMIPRTRGGESQGQIVRIADEKRFGKDNYVVEFMENGKSYTKIVSAKDLKPTISQGQTVQIQRSSGMYQRAVIVHVDKKSSDVIVNFEALNGDIMRKRVPVSEVEKLNPSILSGNLAPTRGR